MVALTQENGKVLCLHVPSRHEYNGQVCDLQPHHDASQEQERFYVTVERDKTNLSLSGEKYIPLGSL